MRIIKSEKIYYTILLKSLNVLVYQCSLVRQPQIMWDDHNCNMTHLLIAMKFSKESGDGMFGDKYFTQRSNLLDLRETI